MPHFPNIFLIQCIYSISQRNMSNGIIYVVDAHFIDKIGEKKETNPGPTCLCIKLRIVSSYHKGQEMSQT
jgi:hypothetical protein